MLASLNQLKSLQNYRWDELYEGGFLDKEYAVRGVVELENRVIDSIPPNDFVGICLPRVGTLSAKISSSLVSRTLIDCRAVSDAWQVAYPG